MGMTATNPEGEPEGQDRKRTELFIFYLIKIDLGVDSFLTPPSRPASTKDSSDPQVGFKVHLLKFGSICYLSWEYCNMGLAKAEPCLH